MKKIIILSIMVFLPVMAFAQNVGNCGWGSKLFDGQRGIAPQVLAVTTNGTSGNQTFAITSGTSGCTQDGVVKSAWRTAAFIDNNMNRLARDISRGEGETLASLSELIGVAKADREVFATALQNNFDNIFAGENIDSNSVYTGIKNTLASNAVLADYSARL